MKMKWGILFVLILFGSRATLGYALEQLDELSRLHSKEIKAYRILMETLEKLESQLLKYHETFTLHQCGSPHFVATPGCKKSIAKMKRQSSLIANKRAELAKLKIKLKDYLEFTHGVLEKAKDKLERSGTSATELSTTLSCLESVGDTYWGTEINKLYTQGMKIMLKHNRQLYFEHLRSLPGFSRDECASQKQVECWRQEGGVYYYVARGHIQISEGCLTQSTATQSNWNNFPSNPQDYLVAARQAANTVKAKNGCYRNINKEKAESLALYFETKHPRIQCSPDPRKADGDKESTERCAYTHYNSSDLYLTAPNLCQGLARTLFHESMHAEGSIDNLPVKYHNSSSCRQYDAVYHCSYLCFPENPRPSYFHSGGCRSCVSEDKAEAMCRGLPNIFDENFQSCNWGHR